MPSERAVCLNCMDGRVQLPVIEWAKKNHNADYVDMITEPGMDGLLADSDYSIEQIKRKIIISVEKNNAKSVIVAGHYDCKGNPVAESVHKEQIQSAVERLKEELKEMPVIGLWVNKEFKGELIC